MGGTVWGVTVWGVETVEVLFEVCRVCKGYGGVEGCAGTCYGRCEAVGVGGREGTLQVGVEEYLLRAVRSPQGVS